MSSAPVRDAITAAVTAAANPIPTFDISDYVSLDDALSDIDSEAVLVQYVTADEQIQSIGGENNQGWEEDGAVVLWFVVPTGFVSSPTVTEGDNIRNQLKGKRLTANLTVESCSPFVDFSPGIDGSWHRWTSNMYYVNRTCGVS
jgi:hypothetical protein